MQKKMIDSQVEECSEDINENEIIYNVTLVNHNAVTLMSIGSFN